MMTVLYDTTYYIGDDAIWENILEFIQVEYKRLHEVNPEVARRYRQSIIDGEREMINKETYDGQ